MSRFESVLAALRAMLPYLLEKSNEAVGAVGYYEGRFRGNDLYALFSDEVKAGRRENHARKVIIDVPFTYPEGDALMKAKRNAKIRAAIARTRAKVTRKEYEAIRAEHLQQGGPLNELVKKYPQYAREMIRRILGRRRLRPCL